MSPFPQSQKNVLSDVLQEVKASANYQGFFLWIRRANFWKWRWVQSRWFRRRGGGGPGDGAGGGDFLKEVVMVHEHLHSSQVLTVPRLLRKIYEDKHH